MILSIFNSQFSIVTFLQTLTAEHLICLAGLALFAYWLLKTSFGARALTDAAPRRNNMPLYLPLIPLFIWFGPVPMAVLIAEKLTRDFLQDWQIAFLDNCIFSAGAIVTITVILFLARAHFARRLRGFGLDVRTMVADFLAAAANLLTIWPLIITTIILTMFFGQRIWGQEYQMQQHQELELITEYSQLPLRIIIVVVAVIVAPLIEELLFRGLVQTMLHSVLENLKFEIQNSKLRSGGPAWLAIAISSGLFTTMHANPGHWPALFVLGMCLGYAYEKSGSLLRPIFIHSFFNGVMIAAALSQS